MTIDEFLDETGMSGSQLARKLRCSDGSISHWRSGRCRPSPKLMAQLVRATQGKVRDADFPDRQNAGPPARKRQVATDENRAKPSAKGVITLGEIWSVAGMRMLEIACRRCELRVAVACESTG